MLDKLRRSKANYLHRKILEYQRLLARVVNLAGEDGLLILDDLYYIRRSDQPLIIDYFHRLTKNQRMWLKVGTIRHRSTWFVRVIQRSAPSSAMTPTPSTSISRWSATTSRRRS
jgi:hypothetical protein